nr:zinc finger MYM-type protein 1 [Tanacetum cinerariifolium]GEW67327.1 zinc finger MYM-type protein 1 [Tanacetum cinerariifolium]
MNKHNLNIDDDNQNINNDDQNAYVEGDFGEVSGDENINDEGVDAENSGANGGDEYIDDECVDYDNIGATIKSNNYEVGGDEPTDVRDVSLKKYDMLDIYDLRNWNTLDSKLRELLLINGPKRDKSIQKGLKDKYHRQFSTLLFTRVLPNGETSDRSWLVYSKELDKVFCFCCQGYDNDSNMKGKHQRVQRKLLDLSSRTFYTPYGSHSLKLALCDMAKTCPKAKNFFGTTQKIDTIFANSTKRWAILKTNVKGLTVKSLSTTRWESRVESVKAIQFQLSDMHEALLQVSKSDNDPLIQSTSESLAENELGKYEFLVAIVIWVGFCTQSLLEKWRDSYGNGDFDEDPYDDDMYEGHDLPQVIQAICDNLDI